MDTSRRRFLQQLLATPFASGFSELATIAQTEISENIITGVATNNWFCIVFKNSLFQKHTLSPFRCLVGSRITGENLNEESSSEQINFHLSQLNQGKDSLEDDLDGILKQVNLYSQMISGYGNFDSRNFCEDQWFKDALNAVAYISPDKAPELAELFSADGWINIFKMSDNARTDFFTAKKSVIESYYNSTIAKVSSQLANALGNEFENLHKITDENEKLRALLEHSDSISRFLQYEIIEPFGVYKVTIKPEVNQEDASKIFDGLKKTINHPDFFTLDEGCNIYKADKVLYLIKGSDYADVLIEIFKDINCCETQTANLPLENTEWEYLYNFSVSNYWQNKLASEIKPESLSSCKY